MITGIQFRTVRPASHSRLLVLFLNDTARLGEIVEEGRKTGPESFESYDDHTLRLGMRYMLFRFGLRFLPEALMVLKNGRLPQLVLLLEFTGDSERETLNAARRAAGSLARFGCPMRITETPRDAEKYWAIRRESFNLLRTKIQGRRTVPFIDDIIVPPSALPRFLPELEAIIAPYKSHMTYTIAGHAGDGNFHIIPLMDLSSEPAREAVFSLADKVYDLVIRYKGSITAEHNDGIMRTPYLEAMYGSKVCALFARVKHIFDPHNIFNPHKKVGGTKEYAIRHLRRS
jgi:FAD/FMN-containing dehydrogenase